MKWLKRIVGGLLGLVVAAVVGLAAWLFFAPPELIRVGTGYAAKIVCSNVFVAGRDPNEVLKVDVQAPGHWLLKYLSVDVDRSTGEVSSGLFGAFARSVAVARDGLGCTSVPDGKLASLARVSVPPPATGSDLKALWPEGEAVQASTDTALTVLLDDTTLTGPGMRAVVVVKDGRILGERYGADFAAITPLLGWSMTKTVTAALIGTLVGEGKLKLDQTALFPAWSDGRAKIALADLMSMSSGLAFNEDYGDVTDVTRMLYREPDMAGYAESKPLADPIGTHFSYSSGSANIASQVWQDAVGDATQALVWPRRHLFDPLGMRSAVLETDEHGTFVGSSYMYASGRDWARFGQMLLQDGVWDGKPVLPAGFVAWMREPAPATKGAYGRGLLWLEGPSFEAGGKDPKSFGLPADTFWMVGHDGQTVAIIPSQGLVVVRMGLTPYKYAYQPQALVAALVKALGT